MDDFSNPAAFGAGPGVDLDEDMEQDALDLDQYEAEGGEEELDEHDSDVGAGMAFDPIALGLKEINNLARCRVSTFKPGNGVKELLDDDLGQYWQYVSLTCTGFTAFKLALPLRTSCHHLPKYRHHPLSQPNCKPLLTVPQDPTAFSLI